jgi:adenylosuccinate synthase
MQRAGDRLDRETEGKWVMDGLVSLAETLPDNAAIIVDSVRIPNQIAAIRQAFGPRVKHIHLMADDETLAARHSQRRERTGEAGDYSAVRRNLTERNVEKLAKTADVVINTKRSTAPDVLVRAAAQLGFYGRQYERLVDVVIGGQYGSEGKGNIVAYLAPEYDVLVRVGGPNAGHKVFEEPVPFTHLMLPSGTRRNENASLVIGPGAVLRVPLLLKEIADCAVDEGRLSIDPQAMIISDEDISAEKELMGAIGSTGQGVGAATARKITGRSGQTVLAKEVPDLAPFVRETYVVLEDAFRLGNRVLLEGTQGTGLSIHHGDYPHVTSRDTTVGGCLGEAGISPSRVRRTVMVCRTYPIRVQSPKGATSGPMTGELTLEEIAARNSIQLEELQNTE